MWFPALIVLEGFKFSIFPLFVFRSLNSNHSGCARFYRAVFAWLDEDR